MATPERPTETVAFVDERGVPITIEGKARARKKLQEAAARHTPEYWATLRRRLGLPARTASELRSMAPAGGNV